MVLYSTGIIPVRLLRSHTHERSSLALGLETETWGLAFDMALQLTVPVHLTGLLKFP